MRRCSLLILGWSLGLSFACASPCEPTDTPFQVAQVPEVETVAQVPEVETVPPSAMPTADPAAIDPAAPTAGVNTPAAAPAIVPLVLERREYFQGSALARVYTQRGQIVQVNHACMEWGGYMEGLLIEPDLSRVVRFGGGPMFEIPGFLIVEQQLQIGSDAGDPWTNNTPAKGVIQASTGAVWVTRVVAINLETGAVHDEPGWDSFSPLAQLDSQGKPTGKVLLARGGASQEYELPTARTGTSIQLWDVAKHRLEEIAQLDGPLIARIGAGRLRVQVSEDQTLELTTGGKRRELAGARVEELDAVALTPGLSVPGEEPPPRWHSPTGRPIRVDVDGRLETPEVGGCRLSTLARVGELALLDDGIYVWPVELDAAAVAADEGMRGEVGLAPGQAPAGHGVR